MFDDNFAKAAEKILANKGSTTVCIFDKGDHYVCFEKHAQFLAKEIFKSSTLLKHSAVSDGRKIQYMVINRNQFENVLKELLLFYQYRVELYHCVNNKAQDWQLKSEASPGNLASFEDILVDAGNVDSTSVIALKVVQTAEKSSVAVGCCDLSPQVFKAVEFVDSQMFSILEALLVRLAPKECILCCNDSRTTCLDSIRTILRRANIPITEWKQGEFKDPNVVQDLNRLLKFKKGTIADCSALPVLSSQHIQECLGALIKYLRLTDDKNAAFGKFRLESVTMNQHMRLDSAAVKSLELFDCGLSGYSSLSSSTLYGVLNKCRTVAGRKVLGDWIRMPLLDVNKINERLDIVEVFVENQEIRRALREDILNKLDDFPKSIRAFSKNKADLLNLFKVYHAIQQLPAINTYLEKVADVKPAIKYAFLLTINELSHEFEKFVSMVQYTLEINRKQTSYEVRIKKDFDENLKKIANEKEEIEAEIHKEYKKAARDLQLDADKSIKLESNSQMGYFMRVSRKDEKLLRGNKRYQILEAQKAGVRFTTASIKNLNADYCQSLKNYDKVHQSIVKEVVGVASGYLECMRKFCDLLATLDVLLTFAELSSTSPIPYIRPIMHEKGSGMLCLKNARHPCLEVEDSVAFIPNDVSFRKEECEFVVLTGPNMGGKSTYLRQTALIAIMAQIGCFVPCSFAEISVIDGVFTRIGASDCQVKGVSTFMAEMIESAYILDAATEHSLIIIDELGRGTSTYDGFGLAYAIAEYIATEIRSFALFATHFHEITSLANEVQTVRNFHVTAEIVDGQLTLLFKVNPGICDESFGIHIAEMVNFPTHVIQDAWKKMKYYNGFGRLENQLNDLVNDSRLPVDEKAARIREILVSR